MTTQKNCTIQGVKFEYSKGTNITVSRTIYINGIHGEIVQVTEKAAKIKMERYGGGFEFAWIPKSCILDETMTFENGVVRTFLEVKDGFPIKTSRF